jgi:hypothetical protein
MEKNEGYPITISLFFRCKYDPVTDSFLQVFGDMTFWWLEKIVVSGAKSQQELRTRYYEEARMRWKEWNSQHVETSSSLAFFIHSHKIEARVLKIAVLSPLVSSIVNGKLRVSLKPRSQFGYVELFAENSQQKVLLKMAEDGLCRLGQAVLFEKGVLIPFLLDLNLSVEKAWQIEELLERPSVSKDS